VPTIIYIHGRGLKPPKDEERRNWLAALNRGLTRLGPPAHQIVDDDNVRLAYWSDLFYPPGADPARDSDPVGVSDPHRAGLNDDQSTAIAALVERFWSWRLGQPAVDSVDGVTKQFEDNFVRDVIKFFGLGYGDTCAEPLRKELRQLPTGGPTMLISHSFGTVLAYEVLVRDIDDINATRAQAGLDPVSIDTWVTMGTPLGWALDLQAEVPGWQTQLIARIDQDLQPALAQARQCLKTIGELTQRRFDELLRKAQPAIAAPAAIAVAVVQLAPKQFPPRSVNRWFNIYDPRDPVACGAGIGALHGGLAVGGTFLFDGQQRAFDVAIRNDGCPPEVFGIDIRAHQDFTGYGQCAQLAQLVADFWQRSSGQWAA
jgi:hypothetical protein